MVQHGQVHGVRVLLRAGATGKDAQVMPLVMQAWHGLVGLGLSIDVEFERLVAIGLA